MSIRSNKYDTVFLFYFAKNINKLLGRNRRFHECIALKDYAIFDHEGQFLKRYYEIDEVPHRIQLLANYFEREKEFPFNSPNMVVNQGNRHIEKRKKRFRKLKRKLEDMQAEESLLFESEFLKTVRTEEIEQQQYRKQFGESNVSYETQLYDIYHFSQDQSEAIQEETPKYKNCILPLVRKNQIERLEQDFQVNNLVCDFKDVDVDRILNEYNNLQDNRKIKSNLDSKQEKPHRKASIQSNYSFQKNFKEKFEKGRFNVLEQDKKHTQSGKIYIVKGLPKKTQQQTSNENLNDYFPNRRKSNKEKKLLERSEQNNPFEQKLKELQKLQFKSPDTRRYEQIYRQKQQRQRSNKLSSHLVAANTERAGIGTDRKSSDVQREMKYMKIIEKLKQKSKKEEIIDKLEKIQSIKSTDRLEKNRKIELIKQKAVELINNNGERKTSLYSKIPKLYTQAEFFKY